MALKRKCPLGALLRVALCVALMLCIHYDTGKAGAQMDREAKMEVLRLAGLEIEENIEAALPQIAEALLDSAEYMWTYLQEKYPSEAFVLMDCVPVRPLQDYDFFALQNEKSPSVSIEVRVYREEETGARHALDNYYTMLIRPAYEQAVSEAMAASFPEHQLFVELSQFLGEAYGERLSLEQAMSMEYGLRPTTWIFVSAAGQTAQGFEQICNQLEKQMDAAGLNGQYTIYALQDGLVPGMTMQDALQLIARHKEENPTYAYLHRWQRYQ